MQKAKALIFSFFPKAETINSSGLYGILIGCCFLPLVSPSLALGIGILISLAGFRNHSIQQYTSKILQASVVLLGFSMNLEEVITASKSGFTETVISVSGVMVVGLLLGRILNTEKNVALLISTGTAICGGSAIAAIAPILKSENYQNSFALIVIFVLNAVALVLFPFVGHQLGLSQEVFGNWAAIAIHDTSSVVGAGAVYGEKALQIATTVKLIRALWIIPLAIVVAMLNKSKEKRSIKFPWFILLFVAAILFSNFFQVYSLSYDHFAWLGKRGMVVALFLIGSGITIDQIKKSGIRSFGLGVSLWIITSIVSLYFLMH